MSGDEPRGTLCILCKPPVAGQVKTRLEGARRNSGAHTRATLGAGGAAQLATAFLEDTYALAQKLCVRRRIVAVAGDDTALPALVPAPTLWPQGDGDLGERMERLARRALREQASWVLLIGTDSPGLPLGHLEAQVRLLEAGHLASLGPTRDGGYYALGLRDAPRGLLHQLPWSTSTTLAETAARLTARGLPPTLGPAWFDVDEPEDLARLWRGITHGKLHAPASERALRQLGWAKPRDGAP